MTKPTAIDLRQLPRFTAQLPVQLSTKELTAEGLITNISESGLQIECPHALLTNLMPNIIRPDPNIPVYFDLHFQVETTEQQFCDINLICSVVYLRRKSQSIYILGCSFKEFQGDSSQQLADYIQNFAIKSID